MALRATGVHVDDDMARLRGLLEQRFGIEPQPKLEECHGEQRSGIVSFEFPGGDPMAVKRHAMRREVVFGCRAGRLRISPHAYNNEEDLDRLVSALTSFGER